MVRKEILLTFFFVAGKTRARDAALAALSSPLLDIGVERATGIVWNITGPADMSLFEVNEAAEIIYDLVDPSANLIFGAVVDPKMSQEVHITLIATGFGKSSEGQQAPGQQTAASEQPVKPPIVERPSSPPGPSVRVRTGKSIYIILHFVITFSTNGAILKMKLFLQVPDFLRRQQG